MLRAYVHEDIFQIKQTWAFGQTAHSLRYWAVGLGLTLAIGLGLFFTYGISAFQAGPILIVIGIACGMSAWAKINKRPADKELPYMLRHLRGSEEQLLTKYGHIPTGVVNKATSSAFARRLRKPRAEVNITLLDMAVEKGCEDGQAKSQG
jgi:hypothetical protein